MNFMYILSMLILLIGVSSQNEDFNTSASSSSQVLLLSFKHRCDLHTVLSFVQCGCVTARMKTQPEIHMQNGCDRMKSGITSPSHSACDRYVQKDGGYKLSQLILDLKYARDQCFNRSVKSLRNIEKFTDMSREEALLTLSHQLYKLLDQLGIGDSPSLSKLIRMINHGKRR